MESASWYKRKTDSDFSLLAINAIAPDDMNKSTSSEKTPAKASEEAKQTLEPFYIKDNEVYAGEFYFEQDTPLPKIGTVLEKSPSSVFPSVFGAWQVTRLGELLRHSSKPNCCLLKEGSSYYLVPVKCIFIDDPLTIDFNQNQWFLGKFTVNN